MPEMGGEVSNALRTPGGGASVPMVAHTAVRRLTPEECEKLQGFPVGFTNIPWRGKPTAPDGPRYKSLGNSMAVPCMSWIFRRIDTVDALSTAQEAA
jgi:DNA (cytosine-5)-methyltransferase 1